MPQDQSGVPNSTSMQAAYDQLNQAALALQAASDNADPGKQSQIDAQCDALQECMGKILQAKLAADQAVFDQTADVLNAQAATLQGMETKLRGLIEDEEELARIVGYIGEAIKFLA